MKNIFLFKYIFKIYLIYENIMKILTIGIYCKGIVELHKNGANSQVFFINELIKNLEGYTPVLFSSYLNSDRVKDEQI